MANLKNITSFDRAPTWDDDVPDDALVLVELQNQVFRVTWAELLAALGS